MRRELVRALPLALLAGALAYLAVVGPQAPREKSAVVGAVDLDFLHREANAALESLRHSHEQRRHVAVLMDAI